MYIRCLSLDRRFVGPIPFDSVPQGFSFVCHKSINFAKAGVKLIPQIRDEIRDGTRYI